MVGSDQNAKGDYRCSLRSPLSAKPPRCSPALSFPRFCWFRPPLRCRSPEADSIRRELEMNGRFLINRGDAKVMGVAAGLADYTGVDPTIVRLGFVAATLLTGPMMILFYILTGLLAPRDRRQPLFPAAARKAMMPAWIRSLQSAALRRCPAGRRSIRRSPSCTPGRSGATGCGSSSRSSPASAAARPPNSTAIASLDEARAYLEHPLLGARLSQSRRGIAPLVRAAQRGADPRRRSTRSNSAPA